MSEIEQLREQSSYEHGQRIRIEAERNQLREQLAAERESRQDYQGEAYDLNLKLSIVLKALKEIRDAGYTLNRQDGTNVIDAALAVERDKLPEQLAVERDARAAAERWNAEQLERQLT